MKQRMTRSYLVFGAAQAFLKSPRVTVRLQSFSRRDAAIRCSSQTLHYGIDSDPIQHSTLDAAPVHSLQETKEPQVEFSVVVCSPRSQLELPPSKRVLVNVFL